MSEPKEPSSKSEEIDYERCSREACGYFRYDHNGENPRNLKTGGWIYGHKFKPQPPVIAPEKCPHSITGTPEYCAVCGIGTKPDSAQPTPSEGPLEKIKERVAKITPGKWRWERGSTDGGGEGYAWLNDDGHDLFMCGDKNKRDNAIFVAHARSDVLFLLDFIAQGQSAERAKWEKLKLIATRLVESVSAHADRTACHLCNKNAEALKAELEAETLKGE